MYAPYASSNAGAKAYGRLGLETSVMNASQQQLMLMLFDGAKTAISMARHHMAQGEIAAKGNAISKVINIVDNGLKAALDADANDPAGCELVANLSALYDYIGQRLLQANLRNDPALLDEADRLLESIASAWREVGRHQ
ncbi:flagellar protein FliS [Collimonas sp. OK607]|uniref:flagellar export chaperone FliS n=1 Tax=Collimonas sp. OK607 TaxID=1798194 RepID=UPI0008EC1F2D|nr:flagellar export chaperone FliS [Collimonas sp. OK607]SFB22421.1 flagellar protein FliS [Collimonas sp. OK607]